MIYTSQYLVEKYLSRELSDSEVEIIDDAIAHISAWISGYVHRDWLSLTDHDSDTEPPIEPVATTRTFDGVGGYEIFIDDFTDIESIKFLDYQGNSYQSFSDVTQVIAYPNNNLYKSSFKIRGYCFPKGSANVEVTAVFNSGPVPRDIVMVATALVGKFLIKSSITGVFKRESIEGYSVDYLQGTDVDQDSHSLLRTIDQYRKILL